MRKLLGEGVDDGNSVVKRARAENNERVGDEEEESFLEL